jgi:GntR family galactonate operon transcriptional repressor
MLERFENYLVEEGFAPGDRLPGELELAARFGVSRGSIREIIVHLALLGVLDRAPRRGTVIAVPPAEAIGRVLAFQLRWLGCGREELKSARQMLELAVIPELIRCIAPAQLDKLNDLTDRMSAAENDPEEADRLDLAFHLAMQESARNRLLEVFGHVLSLLFDRKYRMPFHSVEAIRRSVTVHRAMIAAIREKDEGRFAALIKEHIQPL